MNRAQRRKKMKEDKEYRARVKMGAEMALNTLEKMMERHWEKNDESLNEGNIVEDDDSDESLNY